MAVGRFDGNHLLALSTLPCFAFVRLEAVSSDAKVSFLAVEVFTLDPGLGVHLVRRDLILQVRSTNPFCPVS